MPIPEIVQEWQAEARLEGRNEGRKEGRNEGRNEGLRKARYIFAIQEAQEKLGEVVNTEEELLGHSIEELRTLSEEYGERQIQKNNNQPGI